jgi:c-di-GMP-binding flagellar brake protein YcgR
MVLIILLIVLVGSLVGILILRKLGGGSFPWLHFYSKGKEAGFSIKEINLLRKVAVENRLENPTSLFWSIKQLARSIRGTVVKFRTEGKETQEPYSSFIGKLYEFRKQVELNLPKYTLGLTSSRKIVQHQRLKVTIPALPQAVFTSSVVENLKRYLAISYPEGPKLPDGFTWAGQTIGIYFWRTDDAGYVFTTKVMEDFSGKQYPILHVAHSETLTRSQKRRSIRVEVDMPATVYPLKSIDQGNAEIERKPGLRSKLIDISEDGAAMLVGGRAKPGVALKIQFKLDGGPVVMLGVVKGVNFDVKRGQSVLHLQAMIPSQNMKNQILSYVYNIFGERAEVGKTKRPAARPAAPSPQTPPAVGVQATPPGKPNGTPSGALKAAPQPAPKGVPSKAASPQGSAGKGALKA